MDASNEQLQALILRNQEARHQMLGQLRTFKERVDIPARIKKNIYANKSLWIGGAVVGGLVLSRLFRSPAVVVKEQTKRSGVSGLAATALIALAKPAIKNLLMNEIKKRIAGKDLKQ